MGATFHFRLCLRLGKLRHLATEYPYPAAPYRHWCSGAITSLHFEWTNSRIIPPVDGPGQLVAPSGGPSEQLRFDRPLPQSRGYLNETWPGGLRTGPTAAPVPIPIESSPARCWLRWCVLRRGLLQCETPAFCTCRSYLNLYPYLTFACLPAYLT